MFRFLILFCLQSVLLLGDVLGNTSVKPRIKRALSTQQSSRLSVKHLLLELAEKNSDLDATKNSVDILLKDRCTNIESVGKPVTHNTRQHIQGAWMKDPLGIMGAETIFVMEYYHSKVLQEFENMDMFKAGVPRKTYTLPYYWDGTGGVVYGPYLYYNRAYTNYIVKYNLQTEQVDAQITLSGHTSRKNHYQWGGYSSMDLAVDEQGLWVLWGSTGNSGRLYAYKIDVYNNDATTHTWTLNTEPMGSMGNAFVACGVIYCIDAYNTNPTTINFAYDTKTGKQWNPNIRFTNQYGYNSMVAYNPREKVLYAWDNKRQVTYPITFKEH